MEKNMYRTFFEVQKQHWWFVTRKNIVLDTIRRYLKKPGHNEILDVGCGCGLMLQSLAEFGNVHGMDMSEDAISFSSEIFDGRLTLGALPDDVPYQSNTFDLITALDIIEHIDNDTQSLVTLRELLTDNGIAVITVPAYMFLWSPFDDMNQHKRRYTLKELRQKLHEAGLETEKISYYNTLLFPLVFLVRLLNNISGRDGSSDLEIPSKPVNYILTRIFDFEKHLLRRLNLPFGVSIIAVVRKQA